MKHNALFQAQLAKVSPQVKKETEWSAGIVDNIERILKKKGMTQRELAVLVGCNETQIVRWTRGFPNFTLSTLAKLSVALGEDLVSVGVNMFPETGVNGYDNQGKSSRTYFSEPEVSYGKDQ